MTAPERLTEVASLLARGVLRHRLRAAAPPARPAGDTRAQRPSGEIGGHPGVRDRPRLEGLDPLEAGLALVSFRHEYNHERPHMALEYRFPIEAYLERSALPADHHNPPQD